MKSRKLLEEEQAETNKRSIIIPAYGGAEEYPLDDAIVKIKPVECLNDFVAILVTTLKSTIQLTEAAKYKNEGMVIGVGPGVSDGNGGRVPSQLSLGDIVLFKDNNVAMQLDPEEGFYKGKKVVILSEKSLILKLSPRPFEIV
jgi:co-chaperonin GroES (HSP10)